MLKEQSLVENKSVWVDSGGCELSRSWTHLPCLDNWVSSHCLFNTFRNIQIGKLDLPLSRAGFGELLPLIGAVQVPQQPSHLWRNLKSSVFLGDNLYMDTGESRENGEVDRASFQEITFVVKLP